MIDIDRLSNTFTVRRMGDPDVEEILHLCQGNTLFYQYCQASLTREQILNDLHITPPDTDISRKYYVGFYQDDDLVAVMDLIDGYPEDDIAFIGFFMMDASFQGKGIGSMIIGDVAGYQKESGTRAIRLGIDKDNPQSNSFWKKNGFNVIQEADRDGWIILIAERIL